MNSKIKLSAESIQYFLSLASVANSWDGEIRVHNDLTEEERGWLRELLRNGLVGVSFGYYWPDWCERGYLLIRAYPAGCEFAKSLGAEWPETR